MKKICIVTGSRAEYGLLSSLMKLIQIDTELTLQIIATNMHLSPEFGYTYKEIEKDGFRIDKKVDMLISSDTEIATVKSVGLALIGFADAFNELKPDLLLVLGDRSEILAAVSAALIFKIPVAHIHGGEITEGAYDDAIRHSITKMSHLHFASTEEYRNRIIQLGEEPNRVFNVGAIGIDNIRNQKLLSKAKLEESIGFKLGKNCILVTFHPVTLEKNTSEAQIKNLLIALDSFSDQRIVFTMPNSDTDGSIIRQLINEFVENNQERSLAVTSLGNIRYLSILQFVIAVIGNSSSGIIEVPCFGIPSLNIGSRQRGRIKGLTVMDCDPEEVKIKEKIREILTPEFRKACRNNINPYEKTNTAENILSVIKKTDLKNIIQKRFHNLKYEKL